jgi:hypothetical protein
VTDRLRLVEVVVQPVIMRDDGEHLTPVQVQPIRVSAADLDAFPAKLLSDLAAAEQSVVPHDPLMKET